MKLKILVIDNELDIAELVKIMLDEFYDVAILTDPLKAIETALDYKPDAILLDLRMPKKDGWQIFREFKKIPQLAHIPVGILTAQNEQLDSMIALNVMNANAYIPKPFCKQVLINKVNELFKKREK